MGWKTQEAYEHANERDFKRGPRQQRFVVERICAVAALIIVFAVMIVSQFR